MDKDVLLNIKLPKSWTKATISEMISANGIFVDGDWIESKDQDPNGEVRLIQLADIGDGDFRNKSNRFLTLKRANEIGCTFLLEGDILVARMPDPIGRACLFQLKGENKFITAVDVAIIRTGKESINNKLLNYFINSPIVRNKIEALQSGTTRKRISRGNLSLIEFPVPPLNEQNRIVEKLDELLSELEKGQEQLQTSLDQLKIYRQSILKYAFAGKLSEEWKNKQKRLKTSSELLDEINAYRKQQYEKQLKQFKAGKVKVKPTEPKEASLPTKVELEEKPELPVGWTYIKLNETVENESIKINPSKESKLKFIGMDCIEPHSLRPTKYHSFSDFKSAGNYFEKDRVLYGRMRPYLNKVWRTEFNGACSGEFLVLNPIPVLNPDFLKYKLHSSEFVTFAMGNISGDRPRISYEEVASYILPICSLPEQVETINQIEKLFSSIDVMEKTIEENLLKSDSLKQGLLQKAFEGKLVEQDHNDEPASVLLERIKKEREEYLKTEKERKKTEKPLHIKSRQMAEELKRIIEILKESKEPVSTKTLWQSSTHKDDIDDFYATLKKHIEAGEIIELPRKGKESFLKLANSK